MSHTSHSGTAAMSRVGIPPQRDTRPRQDLFRLRKTIEEMRRFISSLDEEITLEEERAHVHDQSHYSYPIAAKTMRGRRDNLALTVAALEARLTVAV